MWLIDKLVAVWNISFSFQTLLSAVLLSSGFLITFVGVWSFRKAATTVDPMNPEQASQLVTKGIYTFTRNPMYLGMLLVLLSWMIYLGSLFNVLIVIAFVWFINRYQIPPEEKALQQLFKEEYESYCSRTRRWI